MDTVDQDSIRTVTGREVNLLRPEMKDIVIEDIAAGLANENALGRQALAFVPVAQHAYLASSLVDKTDLEAQKIALLWNAEVAYNASGSPEMRSVIAKVCGLPLDFPGNVKVQQVYGRLIKTEALLFLKDHNGRIPPAYETPHEPFQALSITPWTPEFARGRFLSRFTELFLTGVEPPHYEVLRRQIEAAERVLVAQAPVLASLAEV